ncbi:MAG: hypothetical protein V3W41_17865 [Planctomycetota bacterium]
MMGRCVNPVRWWLLRVVSIVFLLAACGPSESNSHTECKTKTYSQAEAVALSKFLMGRVANNGDRAGSIVFDRMSFEMNREAGLRRRQLDPTSVWIPPEGFLWFPDSPSFGIDVTAEESARRQQEFREQLDERPWEIYGQWIYLDSGLKLKLGRGFFNEDDFRSAEISKGVYQRVSGGAWHWSKGLKLHLCSKRQELMANFSKKIVGNNVVVIFDGMVFHVATVNGVISEFVELTRGGGDYSKKEQLQILRVINK